MMHTAQLEWIILVLDVIRTVITAYETPMVYLVRDYLILFLSSNPWFSVLDA